MTIRHVFLSAALTFASGPAFANCIDHISFLEEVLDEVSKMAISASSGGQGVAGAREAQAMSEGDSQDPAVPYQEEPEAEDAVEEAEEAGDGGDDIIRARAALGEARGLADAGDAAGCEKQAREVLIGLIQD